MTSPISGILPVVMEDKIVYFDIQASVHFLKGCSAGLDNFPIYQEQPGNFSNFRKNLNITQPALQKVMLVNLGKKLKYCTGTGSLESAFTVI